MEGPMAHCLSPPSVLRHAFFPPVGLFGPRRMERKEGDGDEKLLCLSPTLLPPREGLSQHPPTAPWGCFCSQMRSLRLWEIWDLLARVCRTL